MTLRYLTTIALTMTLLIISGCAPQPKIANENHLKLHQEKTKSLLILPPMNLSTDAEAKDSYMSTLEMPFASMGYYVLPVEMVSDIMKQEGITSTEMLYEMPLNKLQEYFGADAVLYTRIKKWDVSYMVFASTITVSVSAEIISTKTSEKLWSNTGSVTENLTGQNSGGSAIGLLVSLVDTAINTAAADYVKYARIANARLINSLPVGPYHPLYINDKESPVKQ